MKLLKVIEKAKCDFCGEEIEVCHVEMKGKRTAVLCFEDLQKLARMTLKEPDCVVSQKGS